MKKKKHPLVLGIIPARGGSKSIPKKNIAKLGGKPMLFYILDAALKSAYLSDVVVSSDDEEILRVAEKYGGAEVLLKRPNYLARDTTPDVPVLQHAVLCSERKYKCIFDYVVQLHVTTPFVSVQDIDESLKKLIAHPRADSIVSVYRVPELHPKKLKKIVEGKLEQFIPEMAEITTSRRQDLEPVYKRNAGLYASKRSVVIEKERVWGDYCLAHEMPRERSFDINNPVDLIIAEAVLKHLKRRSGVHIPHA
ncbi:MAG: acylneuraminate cytidylyltransferase family protein [Candidatus Sungbacteria bacterium]|nr:acylneuraminate cytidylyltransferase family protein [Candidatus Sungbacteria bacterium]